MVYDKYLKTAYLAHRNTDLREYKQSCKYRKEIWKKYKNDQPYDDINDFMLAIDTAYIVNGVNNIEARINVDDIDGISNEKPFNPRSKMMITQIPNEYTLYYKRYYGRQLAIKIVKEPSPDDINTEYPIVIDLSKWMLDPVERDIYSAIKMSFGGLIPFGFDVAHDIRLINDTIECVALPSLYDLKKYHIKIDIEDFTEISEWNIKELQIIPTGYCNLANIGKMIFNRDKIGIPTSYSTGHIFMGPMSPHINKNVSDIIYDNTDQFIISGLLVYDSDDGPKIIPSIWCTELDGDTVIFKVLRYGNTTDFEWDPRIFGEMNKVIEQPEMVSYTMSRFITLAEICLIQWLRVTPFDVLDNILEEESSLCDGEEVDAS